MKAIDISGLFKTALLGLSALAAVSGMAEKARAVTVGEARSQPSVTQTLLSQNQQPELILQREDALEPGDSVVDGTVYDEFTFEGRAGQAIAVTVRSDEWVGEIIVIDPQGNPVLRPTVECPENLYCADEDPLSSESLSAVTLTLPQNGTYRLRVQDGEGPSLSRLERCRWLSNAGAG